jgi:hypothetical protein
MADKQEQAIVVASAGNKRLVQIGNVQVEVDLASARPANAFRIGDTVRVLEKDYSGIKSFTGFITEFIEHRGYPAVIVAIIKRAYDKSIKVEFATYNEDSTNLQLVPLMVREFDRDEALSVLDAQIAHDRAELQELNRKRTAFAFAFGRIDERVEPLLVEGKRVTVANGD